MSDVASVVLRLKPGDVVLVWPLLGDPPTPRDLEELAEALGEAVAAAGMSGRVGCVVSGHALRVHLIRAEEAAG